MGFSQCVPAKQIPLATLDTPWRTVLIVRLVNLIQRFYADIFRIRGRSWYQFNSVAWLLFNWA